MIALFPLAAHGGPLWEPLCYAQIGGLTAATFVTLLLVPVFYAICVLDLKIVKWDRAVSNDSPVPETHGGWRRTYRQLQPSWDKTGLHAVLYFRTQ